MKAAARDGAYFVFDTMVYFLEEDLNPQVITGFVTKCRNLISLGAAGVLLLAHPTKQGAKSNEIEVSEWVSGTYQKIGAVDTIFCLKALPASELTKDAYGVYFERAKSRPFLGVKLEPFIVGVHDYLHGTGSYLDRGLMPVLSKPGETRPLRELLSGQRNKGGRPTDSQKDKKLEWIEAHLAEQKGKRINATEVTRRLNSAFTSKHDRTTVSGWIKEIRSDQKTIEQIQAK
jgi:hypothetical protein